ncbi:MAG: DUF1523 family protein [Pelagimonas sp.]
MAYVKWVFILAFWLFVGAVLHYTLPQWDVVRVTGTYEKRENPGGNSLFWAQADTGSDATAPRDVFFIQSQYPDDSVMVFRNEDTGWSWPPFFKFDTADLQAEATNLVSTADAPVWVAVKHYGWRFTPMSIYPNALKMKEVAGPDEREIPWGSIATLVFLIAVFWAVWVRVKRFFDRRLDPIFDRIGDFFSRG